MSLDADVCYRAMTARDTRFDGVFFVGVTTTGIYCRPICPARTPGRARCVFFRRPAEAERAGFRACFRCRPELAPGAAPVDAVSRLVTTAVTRIEAGRLNEGSLDDLAAELGVTGRHLRRALQREIGVAPLELAQSSRLALAKQLLQDTRLPLAQVAFAAGFASVRRFNALFQARFGRTPSDVRRGGRADADVLVVTLGYRPPFAWRHLLDFIAARATRGVEAIEGDRYLRTVRIGAATGWIAARDRPERHALRVEVSPSLATSLMPIAARIRRVFDLDAQPEVIAAHLRRDPLLSSGVRRAPGLRIPGAFDGFELAVRAILGQQVSVAAATTLAGRLAEALGDELTTPHAGLHRVAPTAPRIAATTEAELASIGLPRARAAALRTLAGAVSSGRLSLEPGADPEATATALEQLPGVGPWTARYIVMRALGAADAFPDSDLGLRRATGGLSPARLRERAEPWRPWRAYAALHLWTTTPGG